MPLAAKVYDIVCTVRLGTNDISQKHFYQDLIYLHINSSFCGHSIKENYLRAFVFCLVYTIITTCDALS